MTETDATRKPLNAIPYNYIPYLQKYRVYKLFKDMLADLVTELPKDHLKYMKIFLTRHRHKSSDINRIMLLVSPELHIDVKKLVRELIKDLGHFVVTRRLVMDKYEKDDDYRPGCFSVPLMAKVTKALVAREAVISAGWLMFDHPCTVREARCLQAEGVLPTVTLVLRPPPSDNPKTPSNRTAKRSFHDPDFEGLCFAYKATLKEVYIEPGLVKEIEKISAKCFNGIQACVAGAQGSGQGFHMLGAPGVYRVIIIAARGSGRRTQAKLLAQSMGLVYLDFWELYAQAKVRNDEMGQQMRAYGPSLHHKRQIVKRRIMEKDCIENGWVMVGYPMSGREFEDLDNMLTPPNRVIFLNVDQKICSSRLLATGIDWCTGETVSMPAPAGREGRVVSYPGRKEQQIDSDLDYYYTEALAELRASAGLTAVEINADQETIEAVHIKIQAAVMASPTSDIIAGAQLRNVKGE